MKIRLFNQVDTFAIQNRITLSFILIKKYEERKEQKNILLDREERMINFESSTAGSFQGDLSLENS